MDNNMENKVVYLRLDDIIPNRFQPREVFDEQELEELATSIKEHGVIQPIIVRQIGDKYELIAGERRSKASSLAGLTTIPAIIRNMDDKESAKVSLLENLQRKNLSAIEEARTYERIIELDNMTQSELAKTMGKSQPMIANKLRLLSLPLEVQNALIKNQISERHARSLLNVKDKEQQIALLDKIKTERMTVRELENYIKDMNNANQVVNNQNDMNMVKQANNFQTFNNFNSMGLNDYQSSVNNNIFKNLPNNFNNQFDNTENNRFNNLSTSSTPNDNSLDFNYNAFSSNNNKIDNTPTPSNSLASVFDNNLNNQIDNNNSVNKNIFISQIKEDEVRSNDNQFLPNFNDVSVDNNGPIDNNGQPLTISNKNTYQQNNNYNNNNLNDNYNESLTNLSNEKYNNPMEYSNNQGDLFNQPLNIVSVPNNSLNTFQDELPNTFDNGPTERELQDFRFDNPLDDKYENILFAKPVSISEETQPLETPKPVNNEIANSDNKYITLDPVKTIFSAYDAVYELKKTTDRIKKDGIDLESEEINFDDYYQIIIKIKKNNE